MRLFEHYYGSIMKHKFSISIAYRFSVKMSIGFLLIDSVAFIQERIAPLNEIWLYLIPDLKVSAHVSI